MVKMSKYMFSDVLSGVSRTILKKMSRYTFSYYYFSGGVADNSEKRLIDYVLFNAFSFSRSGVDNSEKRWLSLFCMLFRGVADNSETMSK